MIGRAGSGRGSVIACAVYGLNGTKRCKAGYVEYVAMLMLSMQ